ncbi:MAG: 23S rRNA (pseudouridine(1915)-N(3))-methyltransferase RlmH [Candidatus Cloacimonadales bacterium]
MNFKIICLGKTKQSFIKQGIAEYQKRIGRFGKLSWKILPDIKLTASNNIAQVKAQEAEIILKNLNPRDFLIALDEKGEQFSSPALAAKFQKISVGGKSPVLVIGGVYGLDKSICQKADLLLSFSQLTFTHQMIRLLVAEQIYRALTIIKNKKYHY